MPLFFNALTFVLRLAISVARVVRRSVVLMTLGFTTFYQSMPLQSVLSRETLAAECAREWFDGKVYPLMALQIMVTAEGLHTLIALEGAL